MTIKEQYQRARRNYLRRVRNQEKLGYIVDIIPIPKKPTRASINRLNKQTAQAIKRSSDIQSFINVGEIIDVTTASQRRQLERENRAFLQLTPQEQEIAQEIGSVDKQEILIRLAPPQEDIPNQIDIIISNWYSTLETIRPPEVSYYMTNKTNELLYNATAETRRTFAWAINNNPNVIGEYQYLNKKAIDADFARLRQIMEWAPDSEDYQDFTRMFGTEEVESEDW